MTKLVKDDIEWRVNLLVRPPRSASQYTLEEWTSIVLNELSLAPVGFFGEKNGNFRGHPHTLATRLKISKNNGRGMKGRFGALNPLFGRKRPDSIEIARKMGLANRGKPAWNSGKTGLQKCSEETKKKMSLAKLGILKEKVICPHCGKIGGKPAMERWHFDNCKEKK